MDHHDTAGGMESSSVPADTSPLHLDTRYLALLSSKDSLARATAEHQLNRLHRARMSPTATHGLEEPAEPELSATILSDLVEQTVGPLHERPNGDLEGACPWHDSTSGRCLVLFADSCRWWCRSCRRGGDAAAWLALVEGIPLAQARRRLGLPTERQLRAKRRPTLRTEVVTWPCDLN